MSTVSISINRASRKMKYVYLYNGNYIYENTWLGLMLELTMKIRETLTPKGLQKRMLWFLVIEFL